MSKFIQVGNSIINVDTISSIKYYSHYKEQEDGKCYKLNLIGDMQGIIINEKEYEDIKKRLVGKDILNETI